MRNIVANRMAKKGLCFSSENYQLVRKIVIKGHYSGCFTIFFFAQHYIRTPIDGFY